MEKKTAQLIVITTLLLLVVLVIANIFLRDEKIEKNIDEENITPASSNQTLETSGDNEEEIDLGWELVLVNSNHKIPEDYEFVLVTLDGTRKFDERAVAYLKQMIKDAKADGVSSIWAQSTYRSIELQDELYTRKVELYLNQGHKIKEAMALAEQIVNKPGHSEHNLGLSVDFNNVDDSFADTKAFTWLVENAENYGFVLRYDKDKEDITGVSYEPWHWRYVGIEHAKEMNELGMCLEEYVEYMKMKLKENAM